MKNLKHLRQRAYVITDPEMTVMIDTEITTDHRITIHERINDIDMLLEYRAIFEPSCKAELLAAMQEAIEILKQLPDSGTLTDLASAMGSDLASLEC